MYKLLELSWASEATPLDALTSGEERIQTTFLKIYFN